MCLSFLDLNSTHTKQHKLPIRCPIPNPEGQGAVEAALLSESLKPENFVSLATSVREPVASV